MKTSALFISIFICLNLNAQKEKTLLSSWHEGVITESNIPSDKYSFFEKAKLFYFLSNNSDNIYIDIKVEDSGVQNRILKEGLIIWIDMDNKTAKKTGVRFPIGSQYSRGRNRPGSSDVTTNPDGSQVTPLSLANTIELMGFSNEEKKRFPSENNDNFRGSVKYDNQGILHYNLTMPVSKLAVRNDKSGNGAMPFSIGVEYGVPPVSDAPQRMGDGSMSSGAPPGKSGGRGGAGASGGGGMSRGGASGGGYSGGGQMGASAKPPVHFWIKSIKLAAGK